MNRDLPRRQTAAYNLVNPPGATLRVGRPLYCLPAGPVMLCAIFLAVALLHTGYLPFKAVKAYLSPTGRLSQSFALSYYPLSKNSPVKKLYGETLARRLESPAATEAPQTVERQTADAQSAPPNRFENNGSTFLSLLVRMLGSPRERKMRGEIDMQARLSAEAADESERLIVVSANPDGSETTILSVQPQNDATAIPSRLILPAASRLQSSVRPVSYAVNSLKDSQNVSLSYQVFPFLRWGKQRLIVEIATMLIELNESKSTSASQDPVYRLTGHGNRVTVGDDDRDGTQSDTGADTRANLLRALERPFDQLRSVAETLQS